MFKPAKYDNNFQIKKIHKFQTWVYGIKSTLVLEHKNNVVTYVLQNFFEYHENKKRYLIYVLIFNWHDNLIIFAYCFICKQKTRTLHH